MSDPLSRRSGPWVALFGDPVSHSLSPAFQNAAFMACQMDCRYELRQVSAADLSREMEAASADPACLGLNLTIPHKQAAAAHVIACSTVAQRLGAINVVWRQGDGWQGDNSDGPAFLQATAACGWQPCDADVVMLGAGGAAQAVAITLADAGAKVYILNRSSGRASALAQRAGSNVRVAESAAALPSAVSLVVQATSLGLAASPGTQDWREAHDWFGLLPWNRWHRQPPLAVDLVYRPRSTPFLEIARTHGSVVQDGLAMLLYQGAISFERWTGRPAPLAVMQAALQHAASLAERLPTESLPQTPLDE